MRAVPKRVPHPAEILVRKVLLPILLVVGGIIAAALLLTGCSSPAPHGIPNLRVVSPGILRGGQPDAQGWEYLAAQGITNVIKLNGGEDTAPPNMRVRMFPISLAEQTIGKPDRDRVLAAAAAIQPGTFVHCTHGEDRTGLIIGAYRVGREGWTKRAAYGEMKANGFHPWLRGLYWSWEDDVWPARRAVLVGPPPATTTAEFTWVSPNPEWTGFIPVHRTEIYSGTNPAALVLSLVVTNAHQFVHVSNQWRGYAVTNSVTAVSASPQFFFGRRDYDWNGELIRYKTQN